MYTAWRENGGPTLYPENKTPVTADVLFAGFVFASAILGLSFLVVIFGFRGKRIAWNALIIYGELLILTSILLCNFGQDWEVASLANTTVQYKAGVREEIQANIGVSIGLRSVNITLKTEPTVVQLNDGQMNETINYNERFSWNSMGFDQGRAGFGPNAGLVNREYRAAQLRGAPYPILWVAEYFTLDGEGIRWGRFYRQAGYYAHICLWLAFPMWIFTILLFNTVLRYGGYFSMLTGVVLGTANLIYCLVRNPLDLAIPLSAEHILMFHWGLCFWLNLATACLTFVIGLTVFVIDVTCYQRLATWCGVDPLQDTTEVYGDAKSHWSPGIISGSSADDSNQVIQVIPFDEKKKSRPIMSARPREENYGPSMRLVRKKTMFDGFQRDNTILLAPQLPGTIEETGSMTTTSDDIISCNTSSSSLSSGYKSSSAGSSSSRERTPKRKLWWESGKVSPVRTKPQ